MSQARQQQEFNDGIVLFCSLENKAKTGDTPVEKLITKEKLRYHQRTVGINRIYAAKQVNETVDNLIRCPRIKSVGAEDVAVLENGEQYTVKLVQYPEGVEPPAMDVTLIKTEVQYEFA